MVTAPDPPPPAERECDGPAARQMLQSALRRLRLQLEAVGELSQAEEALAGDVEGMARKVTELATRAVGCERANVWLFDADETVLRCIDCFESTPARHAAGMVLEERAFGREFQALKNARYIAADDALTDPRTAGYVASYLTPLGITSMLDTVIEVSGKRLGLLCLEHVAVPHRWHDDEITFTAQLADKIGLALLSRMRHRAEAEVRASAAELHEAQRVARLGSWTWDPRSGRVDWSAELFRMTGRDPALGAPSLAGHAALLTPASYAVMLDALQTCAERGVPYEHDLEFHREGGGTGWILARGMAERGDDGTIVRGTVIDITERRRTEDELRRVQAAFAEAQAVAHVGSWQIDLRTSRLTWSEESARIFGDDPCTQPSFDLFLGHLHRDDRGRVAESFARAVNEHAPYEVEHRIVRPDGTVRLVRQRGRTTYAEDGTPQHVTGTVQDVTRQRAAEAALVQERDFSTAVIDSLPGLFVMLDGSGRLVRWNANVPRQSGLPGERLSGLDALSLVVEADRALAVETVARAFASGAAECELAMWSKDGGTRIVQWTGRRIASGEGSYLLAVGSDVTERRRAEAQVRSMARVDALTGLANRAVFVEALQSTTMRARRGDGGFAVLYLDLDHFKDVNDTLGHPVGDLLLQGIAARLRDAVRETDTVARFGGDEFAIIAQGIRDPSDAATLADKLLHALGEPFSLQGNDVRTGASVGIAVFDADVRDDEQLLSHADVALYRAKAEGRGTYRFFTESMDDEVRERVALGADLRVALASGQLFLLYQPQVDLHTGRIVGLEALLRWRHPTRGLVPPSHFIPQAERCGLIVPVGDWVLRTACRQASEWIAAGVAPPRVAVNVSALQFKSPEDLETTITATLAETGLDPRRLELEVTESVFMPVSRDVLERLRRTGIHIAIDDFGTGYSSLSYLSQYPVDRIKIAQEFIFELTRTSRSAAIVKASIGLAHELGLDLVVEGIETVEQLELVRAWGAPNGQGFLFWRPLPAGDVPALLDAMRARQPRGRTDAERRLH